MTRFIRLSRGGAIMIPSGEWCPECDARPKWVRSRTPEGKDPLPVSGDPEGAVYYCQLCGFEWPVVI